MRRILCILLALIVCLLLADDARFAELEGYSVEFVEAVQAGDFGTAYLEFNQQMKQAMSESDLKNLWIGVLEAFGDFQKIGIVSSMQHQEYVIVLVDVHFANSTRGVRVVWDADDRIGGLFLVEPNEQPEWNPPDYADRARFQSEMMKVKTGKFELDGMIHYPIEAGKYPAIVLVHGSGPQDMDENIFGNKVFRDIAYGLASRGIVVLQYNKRTYQFPEEMSKLKDITVNEETIDDAVSAFNLLSKHQKVDPDKVFILGHSLGGYLLPRIAQRAKNAKGLVYLAPSARPLEDLIVEQITYIANIDGEVTDEEKAQIVFADDARKMVKSPELSKKTPSEKLPFGVAASYWLDLRGYEPAEMAGDIEIPMIFLFGERDYQVTAEDAKIFQKALDGRDDVVFKSYPKLNHTFFIGEGMATPGEYTVAGQHVDIVVIEDISEWIGKVTEK